MHTITTIESTSESITRECTCGWLTIGTIPEPDHHTPLAVREAWHLEEMARIADGSVWNEIPARQSYQLHLRRRLRTGEPSEVVITAIWLGGHRQVLTYPWTAHGLTQAQTWCEKHPTTWAHSGFPIRPGELATHANAR